MNYLIVDASRKRIYDYFYEIQKLEEEIQTSISVLGETLSAPEEKDRTWQSLEKMAESIGNRIVEDLYKLETAHFSLESDKLKEGKIRLVEQYKNLLEVLNKKKSFISEQREKKIIPIIPFHQERPQEGYCYSCKVDLRRSKFSYQLEEKLKVVLKIKIVEGARFCSKDCLSKYCKKYEEWKMTQQTKRKIHQDKIIQRKNFLTQLQQEKTRLQEKSNTLKIKEQEAEILYRKELKGAEKQIGGWKRFLYRLGIAKDNSPKTNLDRLRKMRQVCESKLEKKQVQIQQALLDLTIDEQFDQEWEEAEKNSLRTSEKKENEEK